MTKALGDRLRWLREAMGLSQAEISQRTGIHQTAWSLYELGKRWPDHFVAVRIMAKLQITREYLLDGNLQGVAPELAIRIAASHPELVPPTDKRRRTGNGQP